MSKQRSSLGSVIVQLALAIYLVVTGVCLFGVGRSISSEEIKGVTSFFKDISPAINIVIAILLIVCGVVFFLKVFSLDLGKLDDLIKYVTLIVWIVVTVVTLLTYMKELSSILALHWLLVLAKNGLIIGGILCIKDGKN